MAEPDFAGAIDRLYGAPELSGILLAIREVATYGKTVRTIIQHTFPSLYSGRMPHNW
jgi:hypothetical protein